MYADRELCQVVHERKMHSFAQYGKNIQNEITQSHSNEFEKAEYMLNDSLSQIISSIQQDASKRESYVIEISA